MYLIMTKEKPDERTKSEVYQQLNTLPAKESYDGESTKTIQRYLKSEDENVAIITADSRLLLFVDEIFPIDHVFVFEDDRLIKIQDKTIRELRPAHNFMKMYHAGVFTD